MSNFCLKSGMYIFDSDSSKPNLGRRPGKKAHFYLREGPSTPDMNAGSHSGNPNAPPSSSSSSSKESPHKLFRTLSGLLSPTTTPKDKSDRKFFARSNTTPPRHVSTYILSLLEVPAICPFTFHSDAERTAFTSLLMNVQSPYIAPVHSLQFESTGYTGGAIGLVVVRPFYPRGSIRDEIYGAQPLMPYHDKYPPKTKGVSSGMPLHPKKVQAYSRQILAALKVLRSKGITCYNLSSTNVMLMGEGSGTVAVLSDLENSVLCKTPPSYLSNFTLPLEGAVDVDVLHFGHVLVEMATGQRLNRVGPGEAVIKGVDPKVGEVLRLIFGPHTGPSTGAVPGEEDGLLKKGRVNLEDVLKCELFQGAQGAPPPLLAAEEREKSAVKLSFAAKKIVKICMASISNIRAHDLKQFEDLKLPKGGVVLQ